MRYSTITYTSCIVGIFCILYAATISVLRYSPYRLAFSGYTPPTRQVIRQLHPTHVSIASVGIDVPVAEAQYTTTWTLSSDGASHLASSPVPGSVGNSIIYGHNWTSIFANLVQVRPGERITVTLSDGSTEQFEVQAVDVVGADAVEVLRKTTDIRLTLYTCTGLFDQNRFVVTAIRI